MNILLFYKYFISFDFIINVSNIKSTFDMKKKNKK